MRRERTSPNDFSLGIFIGCITSDGAACTAVKGLIVMQQEVAHSYSYRGRTGSVV